jgi:DNA-binding response OmpR family regulator
MPELGGRQLIDTLRQRAIIDKALFVSGYTENSIVHQGVLDSGFEFLAKPFGPATLLARIRLLLSRPRPQ